MLLRSHYQNAYVTRDLDKAMAVQRSRYGLQDFIVFEPDMILKTPKGDRPAKVRAALGWIGSLQIELIEPVSGLVGHYTDYLPENQTDASLRFHHIAVRRENLDDMRAEIKQLGLPVVFEGGVEGIVFIYVDTRESLGHYLEYVWATPEGWKMQGWPDSR